MFASGICLHLFAGDQVIAGVLPGRMFQAEFGRRGFAPQMLSRLAADSGTPTSALVAWNSCGAFMAAVLGISTISYLPFAVFNSVAPVLSVIDGITGFKIVRTTRSETAEETAV